MSQVRSGVALVLIVFLGAGCAPMPEPLSQVDIEPPFLVHTVTPVYPAKAREIGMPGWVNVAVSIDRDGFVEDAWVRSSSHPVFEEPALDAAWRFAFEPAAQDGVRVRSFAIVPVKFELAVRRRLGWRGTGLRLSR